MGAYAGGRAIMLDSLLGSGMTRFALLIWAWQQTGAATTLVSLSGFLWPAVRNVEAALPDHPSTTGEG